MRNKRIKKVIPMIKRNIKEKDKNIK